MRTMRGSTELIIFDCDGVLVDSEIIFNQVMAEDLSEHGLLLDVKQCMALFVGGSMESVQSAVEAKGIKLPSDWIENLYTKVLERLEQGVDPVVGIPEVLQQLSSLGMPFCVASNGPIHKMELTLGKTGILSYFENRMFSAYDINSWKPDPELFLHAAKQFSVAPEKCIVVEDSENGTLAAKRAGMPCLGYAPEGHNEALVANNAQCFSDMSELIGLIGLGQVEHE